MNIGSGSRRSAPATVPSWVRSRPACCCAACAPWICGSQRCCRDRAGDRRNFAGHRGIVACLYPGLQNHPGQRRVRGRCSGGFGGMLSLRVAGGENAGGRGGRAGAGLEARHVARRRREPGRAPRLDRRVRVTGAAGFAAAVGGNSECGGFDRRFGASPDKALLNYLYTYIKAGGAPASVLPAQSPRRIARRSLQRR